MRRAIMNGQTGDLRNQLEMARGLARALGHIHTAGIIHRDIKPENVHIDQNGKVKLMDFGIAKSMDLNLTRPGFTLGTPSYMAPEQVRGQEVTPLVDIYAFGVLLYELLTGTKPIQGKTIQEIFQKILTEPISMEPLEQAAGNPLVVELVRRCVSRNPQERPQSFTEVTQTLDYIVYQMVSGAASGSTSYTAVQQAMGDTTARPAWLIPAIVGGGLLLVFFLVAILFLDQDSTTDEETGKSMPAPEGMILIPAGPFPYGREKRAVDLPNFFIDRTEVSIGAYMKYCESAGIPAPQGDPNEPVSGISLDDANAYARWANKRLPTPEEWEKAARGTKGWLFPWGDQPEISNAAVLNNTATGGKKVPVDSMPQSASSYGVLHLVGNIREYVREYNPPTPEQVTAFGRLMSPAPTAAETWVVARGGSFDQPLPQDGVLNGVLVPARYTGAGIGFRCAKDAR
jgi:serine/threonine-protein kinase